MKILFCIYELDFADHIAISYLSAIAKKHGHDTYFCELKDYKNSLYRVRPNIVAYSLNVTGYDHIVKLHNEYKDVYKFRSIAGGPHVTLNQNLYRTSGMDVWCVGEGEGAWEDYLSCLEQNISYDNVLNLITPNAKNPVRKLITNLDTIPFPDRDLVISNSFLKDAEKKTFYSTRGCPFGCTYCGNSFINELYKGNKIVRRFSVRRFIDEIKYVRDRYKLNFIKIGDDCFSFKVDDWLKEFVEVYSQEIRIPWNCYQRFDLVNDEMLQLMQSAGCYSMTLSVDSTSSYVRETIFGRTQRKKIDIESQLRLIKKYNINTFVNFMLGAPGSTIKDDLESIELCHRANVDYSPYTITTPMVGTKLYDYSKKNNLIPIDYTDEMVQGDFCQRSVYTNFTKKEKDIQLNIYDLGGLTSLMPNWFRWFGYFLIKHIPPNKLYNRIRKIYREYMITHTIFKLKEDIK